MAYSRDEGGEENQDYPDQHTATGTTPNEEFVGRVAGEDAGYAAETGAERRAQAAAEGRERRSDQPPSRPTGDDR